MLNLIQDLIKARLTLEQKIARGRIRHTKFMTDVQSLINVVSADFN